MNLKNVTRNPVKAELYSQEPLYRQAAAELTCERGDEALESLRSTALLMIKPDGLLAGKGEMIIDFVASNGFTMLYWQKVTLEFLKWHSLWRYQLTSATLDRLAVNQLVLDGAALLILLQGRAGDPVPASVKLSSMKGPSDITKQDTNCLRYRLKQPNRVLSFLHVADEPADVLREIAILADPSTRANFWTAILDGRPIELHSIRDEIASYRPQSTDVDLALQRTLQIVKRASGDAAAKASALRELDKMIAGETIKWRSFENKLRKANAKCAQWDLAVIGSARIAYDLENAAKQIPPGTAGVWHEGGQY